MRSYCWNLLPFSSLERYLVSDACIGSSHHHHLPSQVHPLHLFRTTQCSASKLFLLCVRIFNLRSWNLRLTLGRVPLTHNWDREKSSGLAIQFNTWTIWTMDRRTSTTWLHQTPQRRYTIHLIVTPSLFAMPHPLSLATLHLATQYPSELRLTTTKSISHTLT